MATPGDATKLDCYLKCCSKSIYFRIPICKPSLDFHASFKSSIAEPEAAQLVQLLSDARSELTSAYQSSSSYEVKIKAAENYIPLLYRLVDTLQLSTKVQYDKELLFEWQGSITNKGEFFKSTDALYELLMVLHAKAMYHALAAKHLLTADPLAFVSEAGKHLLEASSIMSHLSTKIASGDWKRQFNRRSPNPPELCEHVCGALALLFKAQAQSMSFLKSANVGSTPASIKSRLAVGVVNSLSAAFTAFSGIHDAVALYGDYLEHIYITKQFYTALAYQYSAQVYLEKTEVGNAIGFCEAAKSRLVQQKSSVRPVWSAPGLPKFTGPHTELGHAVAYVLDSVNAIQKQAEQDNKFIYFQAVPGPSSTNSSAGLPLPGLPVEASVMNPGQYLEPAPSQLQPAVLFVHHAKPSIFSSMLSSLVGGSSSSSAALSASSPPLDALAPVPVPVPVPGVGVDDAGAAPVPVPVPDAAPAPTAPPTAPPSNPSAGSYSDEHYARYLQGQYDAAAAAAAAVPVVSPGAPAPPPPAGPKYNSLV